MRKFAKLFLALALVLAFAVSGVLFVYANEPIRLAIDGRSIVVHGQGPVI